MHDLLRRFLVVSALMFWQGGFTFYAAVVVPVGQGVLGSHLSQGMITRQVTQYLNLAGAIALVPLAWEIVAQRSPRWIRTTRGWAWIGMALALVVLVWLHGRLDGLLDLDNEQILDRRAFRTEHRLYLWVSTVQWLCALVYLGVTVAAWRPERARPERSLAS